MKKKLCSLFLSFVMVLGLLSTAAFAADAAPFTAKAGETALAVARSAEDYTYSVTLYDDGWTPIGSQKYTIPLYEVTVPESVETLTLDFGAEERLAYGYDAAGNWQGSYGDYGDGTTGQTTAAISCSVLPDYVRVQTPYVVEGGSWNSTTLYAVRLDQSDGGDSTDYYSLDPVVDQLIPNIAASYTTKSEIRDIISAGVYETAYETELLDAQARQSRVNTILSTLEGDSVTDATAAMAILALRGLGYDPENLEAADGTVLNAVSMLTSAATSSIYNAPYVLLACQQGDYDQSKEQTVLTFVLDSQGDDGSWASSPDATGIVLAALADYAGDSKVDAAVAEAVQYLKDSISDNGDYGATWGETTTYNADSTAMAVIGLTAAGVDLSTVKHAESGAAIVEGLLSYALSDNSGFGYTDNSTRNDWATWDGFWALIAADQGAGYDLFDFTANPNNPAIADKGSQESGDQGGADMPAGDTITVSFQLMTHQTTWIAAHDVATNEDATVADVFCQVLDAREEFSYVDKSGYISSITYNGTTWAEFDAGTNSGWKYTVNGVAPSVGMKDKYLEDGDAIVWYYVTDYTHDTDRDENRCAEEEPVAAELTFNDVSGHWAYGAIEYCCSAGLMSGTSETTFSPDTALSRAMVVTILHSLEGKPNVDGEVPFGDVAANTWYTDAVTWAAENGIVSGYDNGNFGHQDSVTREQLAVILWRYNQLKQRDVSVGEDTNLLSYTDAPAISDWAVPALQWACGAGLMGGYDDGSLLPRGQATRGQMATILMNYLENIA